MSATTSNEAVSADPKPGVQTRSIALNRPLLIIGMLLATALSALDSTVVATAMPSIVGVLGGLPLYSLVVSAYLLTATTTVPLYGKLADMYGRKPVFLVGSSIFILGSALCGLAWDMPSLIAFRALQGVGAGAVLPISLTLVGDLFNVEERAKMQGLFGSVWGVSSIAGPLMGGAIVQFFDWRWVFFINVPIGIVSALLIFLYLREPQLGARTRIDYAGAITLTLGVGVVMLALQNSGQGGFFSPLTLAAYAAGVLLLGLFVWIERRAAAPVISFGLISRPVIAIPCMVGLLGGGVLIGLVAYIPLLVQGAWGGTPIEAGLILAPLSFGWPLASALTGRLLRRFSFRLLAILGTALLTSGILILLGVGLSSPTSDAAVKTALVLLSSFVTGVGFGFSTTAMLIAVQISVPWSERGAATASVQFFRHMGNAIGVAVLGAILTATLAPMLSTPRVQALVEQMPEAARKAGTDPGLGPANALFDLTTRDTLAPDTRNALATALISSLWWVFLTLFVMAAFAALFVLRFPREVHHAEQPQEEQAA